MNISSFNGLVYSCDSGFQIFCFCFEIGGFFLGGFDVLFNFAGCHFGRFLTLLFNIWFLFTIEIGLIKILIDSVRDWRERKGEIEERKRPVLWFSFLWNWRTNRVLRFWHATRPIASSNRPAPWANWVKDPTTRIQPSYVDSGTGGKIRWCGAEHHLR